MRDEKGWALLAMAFIIVSFFSLLLLAVYPLMRAEKDDAAFYIIDRNDYRWRKALCGEAVDQSGVKLTHLGGLWSEYDNSFGWTTTAPPVKNWTKVVTRRVFGNRLYGSTTKKKPATTMIPNSYKYGPDTIWRGYRGKRYLHILPTDDWNYGTWERPRRGKFLPDYHPYKQAYAACSLGGTACGGGGASSSNGCKGTSFKCLTASGIYIEVRDYSEERSNQELSLYSMASCRNSTFKKTGRYTNVSDYVLYTFQSSSDYKGSERVARSDQKVIMVKVREKDSSDPWVIKDTKVICCPMKTNFSTDRNSSLWMCQRSILTFRINFYG